MNIYTTSDLALAAYMALKGLRLLSATKLNSGKFQFEFQDDKNEAQALSVEYVGSDFCRYDNQIRALKKILYSN